MRKFLAILLLPVLLACTVAQTATTTAPATEQSSGRRRAVDSSSRTALIDRIERDTFQWFWDTTNPNNGLVPDRWPTKSFSSIAAVGFGLTAYGIGAERGWVSREAAADRVLTTLEFFLNAPSGPEPAGKTAYKGFYYHFIDMESGERFKTVELSTIDTTLLIAGALFTQSYFDRDTPTERAIREAAEELYRRAEWPWFLQRAPLVSMGWTPENGFIPHDYIGYNEAMILYLLAIGSPTHPIDPSAWQAYTATYKWASFYGYEHLNFGPLFGHQYSHVWVDFRGIQDAYMRGKGIDYHENSRRAALSQRAYAIDNPDGFRGYGENLWGLTACDGPIDATLTVDGRQRAFKTYTARAAAAGEIRDDGTIAPTAAVSSIAFAPEIAIPAAEEMMRRHGARLYRQYGFIDAFNETLANVDPNLKFEHGSIVPGEGWFNTDYLGIDQGPIVAMIENHRSGLVWETMKKNPHIVRGLRRAGFQGGWLDQAP